MIRALAAAALIALPTVADAARLTTPIWTQGSGNPAECRLAYFGQRKDLPVKITIVGYADQPGPYFPQSRTFKMGPNNRGTALVKTCDSVGGDLSCDAFRCVFEVPNTVSARDFTGAACGSPSGTGKYCAAAQ